MKQTAPLSKSQYGIYVECMNHVGEIYYNTAFVFRFLTLSLRHPNHNSNQS